MSLSTSQLSKLPTMYSGLRYLAFKSQVLASSGISSLDSILGGGIPLGSVILLEEDEFAVFSEILFKYYYSEGVASKHSLFMGIPDRRSRNIVYRLPSIVKSGDEDTEDDKTATDYEMKIAWRYQGDSGVSSKPCSALPKNIGHNFDLSSHIPPQQIDSSDITLWPDDNDECKNNLGFEALLKRVATECCSRVNRVLRIGLHSVGSPCWPNNSHQSLPALLYGLRSIIHNTQSTSIILVSVSPQVVKCESLLKRCEDVCDGVIRLESLVNDSNPLYSDYKGLIKVLKYPCINSLSPFHPEANDWAFKLRTRKFIVEKLHIPPEIVSSDKQESSQSQASPLCHRTATNIDF